MDGTPVGQGGRPTAAGIEINTEDPEPGGALPLRIPGDGGFATAGSVEQAMPTPLAFRTDEAASDASAAEGAGWDIALSFLLPARYHLHPQAWRRMDEVLAGRIAVRGQHEGEVHVRTSVNGEGIAGRQADARFLTTALLRTLGLPRTAITREELGPAPLHEDIVQEVDGPREPAEVVDLAARRILRGTVDESAAT
jgi:hypothetical protein